jgi:predicted RNase H-like HicB family nuclease
MKEYAIVFEKGPVSWGAHVPDLPGLFASAESFEETETLIREGIEFHIECLREAGKPVPEPTTRVAVIATAA